MTNYVVLVRMDAVEAKDEWRQFTAINARSARSAIAQALEGDENPYKDGMFIAVPATLMASCHREGRDEDGVEVLVTATQGWLVILWLFIIACWLMIIAWKI